jgi:hypothetical protein
LDLKVRVTWLAADQTPHVHRDIFNSVATIFFRPERTRNAEKYLVLSGSSA